MTFASPAYVQAYRAANNLPFPVLIDINRQAYRAFGLAQGSVSRIYGWRAGRRYVEIFRSQGVRRLRAPTEDTLQLGGDFVIDSKGTLAWGFWSRGPDDRPSVDDLLAEVEKTTR